MRGRLLLIALTLGWSCAAGAEDHHRLGSSVRIAIELPAEGMELVGIPELTGLTLLQQPAITDRMLILDLLLLRPGLQSLPAFPFLTRDRRYWTSPPQTIVVGEPPAGAAGAAEFVDFPHRAQAARAPLALPLLAMVATLLAWFGWRRRRPPADGPVRPVAMDSEPWRAFTARLHRLESVPADEIERLARRMEQLRFGPVAADRVALAEIARRLEQLENPSEGSS